jgi:hypothetical protein
MPKIRGNEPILGPNIEPTRERYSALMPLLREHCLIWAVVDLLRRIRGGYFKFGRKLHSNSWFNHDIRRRSLI